MQTMSERMEGGAELDETRFIDDKINWIENTKICAHIQRI